MESIRIGNVTIPKTAALAPMASVADRAYREICKEFGAAYVVGELASAKALTYSDRKTGELLVLSPKERPAAVQLFGSEPETMAEAAKIALQYSPDILDINMGCPLCFRRSASLVPGHRERGHLYGGGSKKDV